MAVATGLSPHPATPRLLVSPGLSALGVAHGFSTRLGGVSEGRYATLNLGSAWGDRPECVEENLALVGQDLGFATAALCLAVQVHGTEVAAVHAPERRARSADGLATAQRLAVGVLTADCVPILLADGEGRVAAVHAGWRGTVSDIAGRAVDALVALGARRERLHAALGPSIGPCCFEVKDDVAGPFARLSPSLVARRPDGRSFVDLWQANRMLLEAAGFVPAQIESTPPCTHCDARRFFSFRRDGAGIGQHMAVIVGGMP